MMKDKLDAGFSPRRVQYIHAVLRRALGRALRWGWVARNAANLADVPRVDRPEIKPLTPAEISRLLVVLRGERLEALYVLALATGLRQGELLGLRWEDIDLSAGLLHVRRSLQRLHGQTTFAEPKSTRSRRAVAVPPFAIDALRRHLETRDGNAGSGLVFTTMTGNPLHGATVTHQFARLQRRAGIPRRRFHDLRHSCATVLLAQGVAARVVMEMLGHSQISVTLNTYTHVLPEIQQQAATRMEGFFRGLGQERQFRQPAALLLSKLLSPALD